MDTGLLVCAIVLILISLPLYFGKLTNLIAGYNTLNANDKAKINQKTLALVLAITFDITAIVLLVGAFKLLNHIETFIYCIVILVIGMIIANSRLIKK